jgi:ribosomal protein S18 acetylase RimI-like enzyme
MKIIQANSAEEIAAVRRLFEEYAASIETDLCFQNFSKELAGLPGAYAPPRGRLLLALVDGAPVGCVALRPHDDHAGEMKRLFVQPGHQGRGLGRSLVETLFTEARAIGYTSILLDTLPSMQSAQRLYLSLGFVHRPPYFDSPVGGNVFMELNLGDNAKTEGR